MRILFLADGIHPFTIGGMQKYASDMVRCLLHAGCELTLVFSVPYEEDIPSSESVIEKLGLDIRFTPNFKSIGLNFPKSGKFPGHYIRESHELSKSFYLAVKNDLANFDFIYAQGFCAWYMMEQKKKGEKIPLIGVHFHGLNMFQKAYGFRNKANALLFKGIFFWLIWFSLLEGFLMKFIRIWVLEIKYYFSRSELMKARFSQMSII
jgi:hypothetical protein